jgi:hypothetical protein
LNENVGESLRGLPDVVPDDIEYEGHTEALRGDQILRDVVIGKFGGYTASTVEERIWAESRRQKSKKKAYDSVENDTRASQGAKDMFKHTMAGVPQKVKRGNTEEESPEKGSADKKSVEKKDDATSKEE